jgi:hypothetical protein
LHDKFVKSDTVERTFIATIVKLPGSPEVPMKNGNSICRFEFLEALVRLAGEKYRGSGLEKTFSKSLERMLTKDILINFQPEDWQKFRDE